jgi:hypothetical protein
MNETIKKLSDLSNVKIEDTIWTIFDGYVEVESIDFNANYPIKAVGATYAIDGKSRITDHFPSAFLKNPFENISNERWVEVSNDKTCWFKRKLIREKNGKFICWTNAETDEKVEEATKATNWDYMREIEEPEEIEITLDEIAEKFGVSVEQLKIKK